MKAKKKTRVFLGLMEIAGFYSGLQRGFFQIGVDSDFINIYSHKFQYSTGGKSNPYVNALAKIIQFGEGASSLPTRAFWMAVRIVMTGALFLWCLCWYDVFIFSFGETFFRLYDLPIYKFFNKKIVSVLHGSDTRPAYIDGTIMAGHETTDSAYCLRNVKKQQNLVATIERYADFIVAVPLACQLHVRPIFMMQMLGLPLEPIDDFPDEIRESSSNETFRILHSPSHLQVKGTYKIREAIKNLRSKGIKIEYVELSGVSNSEVRRELKKCDCVIDQIYSDTPMAGFAAEAAFEGKAAFVGGYGLDQYAKIVPEGQIPPSIVFLPEELENVLEDFLLNREKLRRVGQDAKKFVKAKWTSRQVAENFIRLLDGDSPAEWHFDPKSLEYLWGVGIEKSRTREIVKNLILNEGSESLLLRNERLKQMFLVMASEEPAAIP